MIRDRLLWLAGLALAVALAGCATAPLPVERSYSGRFSAQAQGNGRASNVSGRFTVEVRGNQQVIDLATPVGTTLARIEIEPGRATATGPEMQMASGPNADQLIEGLLGWRLPVSGLADWLEGRPEPSRPARTQMDSERISRIEQDGWTIRIEEYSTVTNKPRRLQLDRPMVNGQPAVSVRLIVDDPAV
ncbi:MAG: outer-rane lipoprotein LolB [Burkholderiaceae bacterium]|nr:outer-rane lipoprotein LolB [Burkholderiaceae bacterium]MBS1173574.1 outer-rane lipoprotein LolB [Pseudomonadota bacterium]